jgi:hypothetical protein
VPLSPRHAQILEFESSWWLGGTSKAQAIRTRLSISPSRYYALLSQAVAAEGAEEFAPLVVRRVRRRVAERLRQRFEGAPLKDFR